MDRIIYLGSPYSHPDPHIMQLRYEFIRDYAAELINRGICAFSPIVYGHEMAKHNTLPTDAAWWEAFNFAFLARSTELHICCIDGWEESKGLKAEIDFAEKNGIPVSFHYPSWTKGN